MVGFRTNELMSHYLQHCLPNPMGVTGRICDLVKQWPEYWLKPELRVSPEGLRHCKEDTNGLKERHMVVSDYFEGPVYHVTRSYKGACGAVERGNISIPYGTFVVGHRHTGVPCQDRWRKQDLHVKEWMEACASQGLPLRMLGSAELMDAFGLPSKVSDCVTEMEDRKVFDGLGESLGVKMCLDTLGGVFQTMKREKRTQLEHRRGWAPRIKPYDLGEGSGEQPRACELSFPELMRWKWHEGHLESTAQQGLRDGEVVGQGVLVSPSTLLGAGRGLFANRTFASRDCVTEYVGKRLYDHTTAFMMGDKSYLISVGHGTGGIILDGLKEPVDGVGGGSFINSNDKAQAEFVLRESDKRVFVRVKAGRAIQHGEEIFVNYALWE